MNHHNAGNSLRHYSSKCKSALLVRPELLQGCVLCQKPQQRLDY